MGHAAGRGFYRTKIAVNGFMVHCLPALAIFLVIDG